MNKKFFAACIICIFTLALSVTFYFNDQTIIKSENRKINAFPKLPQRFSSSQIHLFFTELTNFYNDNFPNREKIILTLTKLIPSVKTETFSTDKVVIGKDDWLFLGNDYNQTIDKLTGKFYYHNSSNKKYDTTARYTYYSAIADRLLAHTEKILFFIAPNKTSIYPEYLPKFIVPAQKPFHEELTQKMRQEGLTVWYPRQDLLKAKEDALLYYVTDTHWNNYGAFIAFINLLPQLDPAYANIIKKEDFSYKQAKSHAGDLIGIGNLIFSEKDYQDNFIICYKNSPVTAQRSQQTMNEQTKLSHYYNPDAPIDKTVWVIGDSFTNLSLYNFFAFFFKNYYFIHKHDFKSLSAADFSDIHADYVIYECVEREF